ncbi:helix-turn-helix protein [Lachnotalea glycerini]|uniref:Helix-turn-helix protein n=1 Tax=Lachnotalea glycerini TaxID=1763509 RepID=A0A318ELH2_9FIRM|nr:helix-turn-helix domain-containing protein [Lachnotalea glycerini]PXV88376.1 helix-turn-helix protein [Lachnotalea glycerini]
MKVGNTAKRLKEIMEERNLKQIDILNLAQPICEKFNTKLSKSDLSQYVSGRVEPGQDKLSILSLALNVSEAWLMGYEVPKTPVIIEMHKKNNNVLKRLSTYMNSEIELNLLKEFDKLNMEGKAEAVNRVSDLTYIPQYTEQNIVSLEEKKESKKKYEPTEEDIKSLVARNGKKITREQAYDLVSLLFSVDDDEE